MYVSCVTLIHPARVVRTAFTILILVFAVINKLWSYLIRDVAFYIIKQIYL